MGVRRCLIIRKSVFKIDGHLGMENALILAACPLLRYVHHGKVEHFQQAVICREYGPGLCHLAHLPVEAFYGIGGIVAHSSKRQWLPHPLV